MMVGKNIVSLSTVYINLHPDAQCSEKRHYLLPGPYQIHAVPWEQLNGSSAAMLVLQGTANQAGLV